MPASLLRGVAPAGVVVLHPRPMVGAGVGQTTFIGRVRSSRELPWRLTLIIASIIGRRPQAALSQEPTILHCHPLAADYLLPCVTAVLHAGGVFIELHLGNYNSSCKTIGNVTNCSCAPTGEWSQLYWYSAILIVTAQMSWTVREFYEGVGMSMQDDVQYFFFGLRPKETELRARQEVGFWTLMPSAMISWIFAKSIQNAAVWGGRFGIMGGVAYAGWYVSFWTAGLVGYFLRTRSGFSSLPAAVERCYGPAGLLCLNIALLFRLWNEVRASGPHPPIHSFSPSINPTGALAAEAATSRAHHATRYRYATPPTWTLMDARISPESRSRMSSRRSGRMWSVWPRSTQWSHAAAITGGPPSSQRPCRRCTRAWAACVPLSLPMCCKPSWQWSCSSTCSAWARASSPSLARNRVAPLKTCSRGFLKRATSRASRRSRRRCSRASSRTPSTTRCVHRPHLHPRSSRDRRVPLFWQP